jgi:hypothetical protein
MATRIKTVEYGFDANRTSLNAATRLDLSAITLFLENQSRVFRSVQIVVNFDSVETSATSMTSYLLGIKLGSAAFGDVTVTDTFTNSGDPQAWRVVRDVTSYFTSNYGSAVQQTVQVGMQFGGLATINHSVKLIITYEFDDTELLDSGTATSGSNNTLVNSGESWNADEWIDQYVKITGGTGSGQVRRITDNDGTTLTVDSNWGTNPDATSTYQILQAKFKTVRIPIESNLSSLTNTLAEIGTNQVPDLDDLLPEANKSYKDIFFEIFGKDNNSGTTDFQLCFALDSESEVQSGAYEQALDGSVFRYHTWKRTDLDTSNAHAFKARSTVTTRFYALAAILNVTYQYLEGDSTSIMNSLMLPINTNKLWSGGASSASQDREIAEFWIEEPATITLQQSAVFFAFGSLGAVTMNLGVGGQTKRQYVFPAGSVEVGQATLLHRFDSGGAAGSGLTIARGLNRIQLDTFVSNALDGCPAGAYAIVNYTSGKYSGGAERHNKTIIKSLYTGTGSFNRFIFGPVGFDIPESEYFLNAVGYFVSSQVNEGGASGRIVQTLRAERLSGGYIEDGWEEIGTTTLFVDSESSPYWFIYDGTKKFRPFPGHPDGDFYWSTPTASRLYYHEAPTAFIPYNSAFYTMHSITFEVAGNVRGYAGDGSGITVEIFRVDTDEKVESVVTSAGGAYSATVYDNTKTYYASAWEDSTHMGRSGSGAPA